MESLLSTALGLGGYSKVDQPSNFHSTVDSRPIKKKFSTQSADMTKKVRAASSSNSGSGLPGSATTPVQRESLSQSRVQQSNGNIGSLPSTSPFASSPYEILAKEKLHAPPEPQQEQQQEPPHQHQEPSKPQPEQSTKDGTKAEREEELRELRRDKSEKEKDRRYQLNVLFNELGVLLGVAGQNKTQILANAREFLRQHTSGRNAWRKSGT